MKDIAIPGSTKEGWSVFLLMILGVVKGMGWIPADLDLTSLIAAILLVLNTVIFVASKIGAKGSTPFVADPPKP